MFVWVLGYGSNSTVGANSYIAVGTSTAAVFGWQGFYTAAAGALSPLSSAWALLQGSEGFVAPGVYVQVGSGACNYYINVMAYPL
jgi:hypothetical protein